MRDRNHDYVPPSSFLYYRYNQSLKGGRLDDGVAPPLEDLLEKAREVGALDRWETIEGWYVFESSTMSVTIEEPKAKPFVRGLLRGYELALRMRDGSDPGTGR